MVRPTLLSGIQPSGNLTLGNYLGAIQQWQLMKNDFQSLFLVVDLHALTAKIEPSKLREASLDTFALYLACGFNSSEEILFLQSQVLGHTELNWYINCFTYFGELQRMTQFKEKSQKNQNESINAGLFTYPCLMAADILLYQTEVVPVGEDQTQHLELARMLAQRINTFANEDIFTVPKRISPPVGARIMSLTNPRQKMSKSDSDPKSRIELLDDLDSISKKIKSAQTDSFGVINFDREKQPGISNLIEIYAALTQKPYDVVLSESQHWTYLTLKNNVIAAIDAVLTPMQQRFKQYRQDPAELHRLMLVGKDRASALAEPTLKKVRRALGF